MKTGIVYKLNKRWLKPKQDKAYFSEFGTELALLLLVKKYLVPPKSLTTQNRIIQQDKRNPSREINFNN